MHLVLIGAGLQPARGIGRFDIIQPDDLIREALPPYWSAPPHGTCRYTLDLFPSTSSSIDVGSCNLEERGSVLYI
eukprot:scaffold367075_cov16-Prasinocladus_malaysianus.AAC.1